MCVCVCVCVCVQVCYPDRRLCRPTDKLDLQIQAETVAGRQYESGVCVYLYTFY